MSKKHHDQLGDAVAYFAQVKDFITDRRCGCCETTIKAGTPFFWSTEMDAYAGRHFPTCERCFYEITKGLEPQMASWEDTLP